MDENVDHPERGTKEVSPSDVLDIQEPARLDDAAYEEIHLPYLPLPSATPPQTNSSSGSNDAREAVPLSSSRSASTTKTKAGMSGGGVLLGVILGAILGSVLSVATGGSLLLGAGIGSVVGGVLALLPAFFLDGGGLSLLIDLASLEQALAALDCCSILAIFVVTSFVTIAALLLRQSVLLAAEAGASITILILIRVFFARRKHIPQMVQVEERKQML